MSLALFSPSKDFGFADVVCYWRGFGCRLLRCPARVRGRGFGCRLLRFPARVRGGGATYSRQFQLSLALPSHSKDFLFVGVAYVRRGFGCRPRSKDFVLVGVVCSRRGFGCRLLRFPASVALVV